MTIARDGNNDDGDDDRMERGSTEGSDDVEGKVEVFAARGKLEIPFWQGRIRGRLAVGLARVGMMPVSLFEFHNIFTKSMAKCKSSFLFLLSFPFFASMFLDQKKIYSYYYYLPLQLDMKSNGFHLPRFLP